jgi:dihydrodipicolinate reductase
MIKIAVTGASGRMGQTLIEVIEQTDGVVLGVKLDKGDDFNDSQTRIIKTCGTNNHGFICRQTNGKIIKCGFWTGKINQHLLLGSGHL